MKAKTTGALTVIALAAVAVLVLVFWRDGAVEAVYPVERAKRTLAQCVGARLSGLWDGAAAQAQEDWIEFLWCPLAELASANLLPEAFRALAADPDILFEP